MFILKVLKVICFHILLQVLILKGLIRRENFGRNAVIMSVPVAADGFQQSCLAVQVGVFDQGQRNLVVA